MNILAMTLKARNKASAAVNNLRDSTVEAGEKGQKAFRGMGKSVKAMRSDVSSLAGTILSLRTIIIATFAVRILQKFYRALKDTVTWAEKQKEAEIALNTALASHNNLTEVNVKLLREQADALQRTHGVADDVTLSMQALLATYGMNAKEIEHLMPLVIDFSKAKQMELKAAVDLVGKAFVGYTGTLSRYGVILDQTLTQEQKYAQFLQILNKFHGTAAAQAQTFAGKMELLKNDYSDMKEPMGTIIEQILMQSGAVDGLSNAVRNTKAWFEEWKGVIVYLGATGLKKFKDGLVAAYNAVKDWSTDNKVFVWLITFETLILNAIDVSKVFWKAIETGFAGMRDVVDHSIDHLAKKWAEFTGEDKGVIKNLADKEKESLDRMFENAIDRDKELGKVFEDKFSGIGKRMRELRKAMSEAFADPEGKGLSSGSMNWLERLKEKTKDYIQSIKALVTNKNSLNQVQQRSIELTRQEAQQYALASRLEQEQVKYLIGKLGSADRSTIEGLTGVEKKLIGRFKILQKVGADSLSAYSAYQTGIAAEHLKDPKTRVQIDLTEAAKKLVRSGVLDYEADKARRRTAAAGGI